MPWEVPLENVFPENILQLLGDLYRQGREIAFYLTSHSDGRIPNSTNVWGTIP